MHENTRSAAVSVVALCLYKTETKDYLSPTIVMSESSSSSLVAVVECFLLCEDDTYRSLFEKQYHNNTQGFDSNGAVLDYTSALDKWERVIPARRPRKKKKTNNSSRKKITHKKRGKRLHSDEKKTAQRCTMTQQTLPFKRSREKSSGRESAARQEKAVSTPRSK